LGAIADFDFKSDFLPGNLSDPSNFSTGFRLGEKNVFVGERSLLFNSYTKDVINA
jgi:hypothetical protein